MPRLAGLAAAAALLAPTAAHADEVQQWNEIGIKYEVTDEVSASFDQHIRFDVIDTTQLNAFMPEPALAWRPVKWLRLGLGYRLQYERSGSGDMRTRHRFFANLRPRYELGELRLEYRLQFQDQYRPDDATDEWRQTLRNRADVSYRDFKPWIPSASFELHNTIDRDFELDKIWFTAGLSYSKKKHETEIFYRVEVPQANPMDPTIHILGAAFHRDL
jgi:hypothetical protein